MLFFASRPKRAKHCLVTLSLALWLAACGALVAAEGPQPGWFTRAKQSLRPKQDLVISTPERGGTSSAEPVERANYVGLAAPAAGNSPAASVSPPNTASPPKASPRLKTSWFKRGGAQPPRTAFDFWSQDRLNP